MLGLALAATSAEPPLAVTPPKDAASGKDVTGRGHRSLSSPTVMSPHQESLSTTLRTAATAEEPTEYPFDVEGPAAASTETSPRGAPDDDGNGTSSSSTATARPETETFLWDGSTLGNVTDDVNATLEITSIFPESTTTAMSYEASADHLLSDLIATGKLVGGRGVKEYTRGPLGMGWGAYFTGEACLKVEDDVPCWGTADLCLEGFSFSFWHRMDPIIGQQVLLHSDGLSIWYQDVTIIVHVVDGNGTSWHTRVVGPVTAQDGRWRNVGLTWSMADGLQIYLGALRAAYSVYPDTGPSLEEAANSLSSSAATRWNFTALPPLNANGTFFAVGCRLDESTVPWDHFTGSLDELITWNRPLPEEEAELFLGVYDCDLEVNLFKCETDLVQISKRLGSVPLSTNLEVFKETMSHLSLLIMTPHPQDTETFAQIKDLDSHILFQILKQVYRRLVRGYREPYHYTRADLKTMMATNRSLVALTSEILGDWRAPSWSYISKRERWTSLLLAVFFEQWILEILEEARNVKIDWELNFQGLALRIVKMSLAAVREDHGSFVGTKSVKVPTAMLDTAVPDEEVNLVIAEFASLHRTCPVNNTLTTENWRVQWDGPIVSITCSPHFWSSALEKSPIQINFTHFHQIQVGGMLQSPVEGEIKSRHCLRWDLNRSQWREEGCLLYQGELTYSVCHCDRPGFFALTLLIRSPFVAPQQPDWLRMITWFQYLLSVFLLVFYLTAIFVSEGLHERMHVIRFQLGLAALVGTSGSWLDAKTCSWGAPLAHYGMMATALWLFLETHIFFRAVVKAELSIRLPFYIFLGWMLPFIPLEVGYFLYPADFKRCLFDVTQVLKYTVVTPILAISLLSLLWSLVTICNLTSPAIKKSSLVNELGSTSRAHCVICFFFCLTWIFCLLTYVDLKQDSWPGHFLAPFHIFNASLGIYLVVLKGGSSSYFQHHAFRNRPIRPQPIVPSVSDQGVFLAYDDSFLQKERKIFSG